ncbi:hypothetical protein MNAN1_003006 [Malassezia nana]|uniref:Uncharacterized protein n=1 Tax=Malassezia nana TaxID=180528 RepID=A0AAF0J4G8_9BASI|nr:hypothetical protein MNAN1_003006 [Malassezia nana]
MAAVPASLQRVLLALLSVLSMATGVLVSYKAIFEPPKPDFERIDAMSLAQSRTALGLPSEGRLLPIDAPWAVQAEKFFFVLVNIFAELCKTRTGRGGFLAILSMSMPVMLFVCVQAIKPETHKLQRGLIVTGIFLLGQLICMGAALPLLLVPLFALVRGMHLHKVYPERAFGVYGPRVVKMIQRTLLVPSVFMVLVPTTHWSWLMLNVAFQLFPLIFLSLSAYVAFVGPQTSITTSKVSVLYEDNAVFTMVAHWWSLYLLYPVLRAYVSGDRVVLTDSERLIVWDLLGMFLTVIYLIGIDIIADLNLKDESGVRALHSASFSKWLGAIVRSLFMSLIFGPGTMMDIYLAAREDAVTPTHSASTTTKKNKIQ